MMKDVEESLDDVRDDFEGMRMKTEVAVDVTIHPTFFLDLPLVP